MMLNFQSTNRTERSGCGLEGRGREVGGGGGGGGVGEIQKTERHTYRNGNWSCD